MPQRHTHKTDDASAPLCGATLKSDTDATIVAWEELDWDDTDACENCLRGIRAAKKATAKAGAVADRNERKRTKTARTHLGIALRALAALAEAGSVEAEAARDLVVDAISELS
jgi:hypothetical protein